MKYYTKEWYDLMQKMDYTCGMKKIPDKNYSDREIKDFYDKALKKAIGEEKRAYNEPPCFIFGVEDIDDGTVDLEEWIFVDEETGKVTRPTSVDELRAHLEKEQMEEQAEYENRPPFDPEETIRFFEENYRNGIKYAAIGLPNWVTEKVDKRLLALNLLPESVYAQLRQEEKANRKAYEEINKKAAKEWGKQKKKIPREVNEIFQYHDGCILSLVKQGKDIVMMIHVDGLCEDGDTPYQKVIFSDVFYFEREKGLRIRCKGEDGLYVSNCVYLYDEIYLLENETYEFHFLVDAGGLRYITIGCKDIHREKNVRLEQ